MGRQNPSVTLTVGPPHNRSPLCRVWISQGGSRIQTIYQLTHETPSYQVSPTYLLMGQLLYPWPLWAEFERFTPNFSVRI